MTVQVSQTFTLITSLLGIQAYPAADIAALYGDRWTIELVFFELKVTVLGAGTHAAHRTPAASTPRSCTPSPASTRCGCSAPLRRRGLDVPAGRISCAALRAEIITSTIAGHGATALLPAALAGLHTDITRHPGRWIVPHRPGRHYPRYTIKKSGPANPATSSPTRPACTCCPSPPATPPPPPRRPNPPR